MCQKQIETTDGVYRAEHDPYHTICEDCAKKLLALDNLPESEWDYIIATYCTEQQKLNLIKDDPLAYPYFLNDRLSDMRYGSAEDYEEVS